MFAKLRRAKFQRTIGNQERNLMLEFEVNNSVTRDLGIESLVCKFSDQAVSKS